MSLTIRAANKGQLLQEIIDTSTDTEWYSKSITGIGIAAIARGCLAGTVSERYLLFSLREKIVKVMVLKHRAGETMSNLMALPELLKSTQDQLSTLMGAGWKEACKEMEKSLSNEIKRGQDLSSKGDNEEAMALFEKLRDDCNFCPYFKLCCLEELARIYTLLGRFQSADKAIDDSKLALDQIDEQYEKGKKYRTSEYYWNCIHLWLARIWNDEHTPYTKRTLKEHPKINWALELCQKRIDLFDPNSQSEHELTELGRAFKEKARICGLQENDHKCIEYYLRAIGLLENNKQYLIEALISLGDAYQHTRSHEEALKVYERALDISGEIGNKHAEATCYLNIAFCKSVSIGEEIAQILAVEEVSDTYRDAIAIYDELEGLYENPEFQISYFDVHDVAYIAYENFLCRYGEYEKALLLTIKRRARALSRCMPKKRNVDLPELTSIQSVQELAREHQTNFVFYSLAPKQDNTTNNSVRVWAVSEDKFAYEDLIGCDVIKDLATFNGAVHTIFGESRTKVKKDLKQYNIDATIDELISGKKAIGSIRENSKLEEGTLQGLVENVNGLKKAFSDMQKMLRKWGKFLLPSAIRNVHEESCKSLTIIPEAELSYIPFESLPYKEKGGRARYLIEDFPIHHMPSINIMRSLVKKSQVESGLVIGDPSGNLEYAFSESGVVDDFFEVQNVKSSTFKREQATVKAFMGKIETADVVHLACHATDEAKFQPDSIFQGALKMCPTQGGKEVTAEEIYAKTLKAQLVFMNACFSGKGQSHQEGNAGLVWAFLAGGAESVISARWPVYDSQVTLDIVKDFYNALFNCGLTKADALRKAICSAINKEPARPDMWGSFFLTGLNSEIRISKRTSGSSKEKVEDTSWLDFL